MKDTKQNFKIRNILMKNFVNLTKDEKLEILKWRNHVRVRSMMITKDIIPNENHLQFIQNLTLTNNKDYWVIVYNNQKIGVLYLFDIANSKAFWGFYLNPHFIGSAYGILLEYLILEVGFSIYKLTELCCQSLTINRSVIKTHEVFGYETIEVKNFCTLQMITIRSFEKNKKVYELMTKKFWE